MEDWNNIKLELQQVKNLLKDIVNNIWKLETKNLNKKVSKNPLKYIIISNGIIAFIMSLFVFYWFAEYRVIKNNQDKYSYILSQEVDKQKDSIEIETRALYEDIYKNKIDSMQDVINALKAHKVASKPRYKHKSSNYQANKKEATTSTTNASSDDFTPIP